MQMNDFTSFTDKQDDFLVEMTLLGSNKAYEELVIRRTPLFARG